MRGSSTLRSPPTLTRPPLPPPQLTYDPTITTPKSNPVHHSFADGGKYFPLGGGTEAGVAALFPGGLSGGLKNDMRSRDAHTALVRPIGVTLVQHMEHWRRRSAVDLSKMGVTTLDVDGTAPYTPPLIELPYSRAAVFAGGGPPAPPSPVADAVAAAGSGALPSVRMKDGPPVPVLLDPLTLKYTDFRLLTGPLGVGKSALLAYVVAYARSNSWLTLFVPNAWEIMTQGRVLAPARPRPGGSRDGFIDQHDMALKLLQETLSAQAPLLAQVPQRGTYATFRYLPPALDASVTAERGALKRAEEEEKRTLRAEAAAAGGEWDPATFVSKLDSESETGVDRSGFTLHDMVAWGIAHPAQATDTLLDFMNELRSVTEFPVLVAVDGMNLLYEHSAYPEKGEGNPLPCERLTVPSLFHCLGEDGFK